MLAAVSGLIGDEESELRAGAYQKFAVSVNGVYFADRNKHRTSVPVYIFRPEPPIRRCIPTIVDGSGRTSSSQIQLSRLPSLEEFSQFPNLLA